MDYDYYDNDDLLEENHDKKTAMSPLPIKKASVIDNTQKSENFNFYDDYRHIGKKSKEDDLVSTQTALNPTTGPTSASFILPTILSATAVVVVGILIISCVFITFILHDMYTKRRKRTRLNSG